MLEQKTKAYNWYYTQCFLRHPEETYSKVQRFVTFAATPTEAKKVAIDYLNSGNMPEGYSITEEDVHLYQKNYIRESRSMVAAGMFAGTKPDYV